MRKLFTTLLVIILCMVMSITSFAYETGSVTCSLLNVRVSPTTDSDIVTQLPAGANVEIIYTDNGWYNIKMKDGVTGFVSASFIQKNSDAGNNGKKIVDEALKHVGKSYSYGASGPNSFDCSGFSSYVYRQVGYSLPHSSNTQGTLGSYVSKELLALGDLVFFSNRSDRSINHVGIYIGNNNFVHAATSSKGVRVDSLTSSYYVNHYVTARRVI